MLDVVDTEMWSKNVNEEMGYTYLGNVGDARNQSRYVSRGNKMLLRISIYERESCFSKYENLLLASPWIIGGITLRILKFRFPKSQQIYRK